MQGYLHKRIFPRSNFMKVYVEGIGKKVCNPTEKALFSITAGIAGQFNVFP